MTYTCSVGGFSISDSAYHNNISRFHPSRSNHFHLRERMSQLSSQNINLGVNCYLRLPSNNPHPLDNKKTVGFDQQNVRLFLFEFGASTVSQLTVMRHSYCTVQMLSNKHLSAASNLIIQRSIDVTNLRLWCHIRSNFRPRALLLVLYSTSVMYRYNNLLRTASLVFQPRENPNDVSGFYSPSIFLLIRFSTAKTFFFFLDNVH